MDQLKCFKRSPYSQPLRCEKFLNQMNQVIPWEVLCELIQPFILFLESFQLEWHHA